MEWGAGERGREAQGGAGVARGFAPGPQTDAAEGLLAVAEWGADEGGAVGSCFVFGAFLFYSCGLDVEKVPPVGFQAWGRLWNPLTRPCSLDVRSLQASSVWGVTPLACGWGSVPQRRLHIPLLQSEPASLVLLETRGG